MEHTAPAPAGLSHIDADGAPRMVDVGEKQATARTASAEGFVRISAELERAIHANTAKKGPVLEVSRLAGIMAAKRTDELIPLCHTLPLDAVDVEAALERTQSGARIRIAATVRTHSRTGVEMEALTAVAVACLTVIDMGKSIDRDMVIEGIRVTEKRGGRSGDYAATPEERR